MIITFVTLRHALYLTNINGDHAKSAAHLAQNGIDIYASAGTLSALNFTSHRTNVLQSKKVAQIGEFDVLGFDTQHDAKEPMGFLIQNRITKTKICFITDSYYCRYNFKGVTAYLVEANYSESILQANIDSGRILPSMADRTRRSHFEINRVVDFLKASDLTRTKKVILMHMSSGNSNARGFTELVQSKTGIECLEAVPGLEIKI